jgi:glycosyltransferase involved in cell wall biosynthesis
MSTLSTPLVSIIIPTYNRADMLASAIESAIKQTYLNKQIIIVDDGSVDKTRELVAQYPQVEYIYQTNGGQGKARNTGLHVANGVYIASLDSDDIWNEDFIERCVEKLEKENLGFVFANWTQINNNEKSYDFFIASTILNNYIPSNNTNTWITLDNEKLRDIYLKICPSPSSSFVFRKHPTLHWSSHFEIADDWCLLLDMILVNGYNAAFTTDRLWTKRVADQNVYEGKDLIEILEHLHIKDLSAILERHRPNLREAEIAFLERDIYINIYKLYLHKLLGSKLTSSDHEKLKKALRTRPFLLLTASRIFIYFCVKENVKKAIRGILRLVKNPRGKH